MSYFACMIYEHLGMFGGAAGAGVGSYGGADEAGAGSCGVNAGSANTCASADNIGACAGFARRAAMLVFAFVFAAFLSMGTFKPQTAWALFSYEGDMDTSWYNESASDFTISTVAQLAGLSKLVDDGNSFAGKTIALANDIDISGYEWEPIGSPYSTGTAFSGNFNGAGHTVSGLSIDNTEMNQALFGCIKNASIANLAVSGQVTCSEGAAGIVASATESTLYNLVNYVNVNALGTASSSSYAKAYNGTAAGVVNTSTAMSGDGGDITYEKLVNYGSIRGNASTGISGVAGVLNAGDGWTYTLKSCFNYGSVYVAEAQNVDGLEYGVGGVLGSTSAYGTYHVLSCGNEGSITASNLGSVGGLIGSIRGENSTVDSSYNTGSVTNMGNDFNAPTNEHPTAGSLISQFESVGGTVSNNYTTGVVSSSTGHSAAIIGASSLDMTDIAYNNYYLEGTATGAFNDMETGESSESMLSGESLSAEELAEKIDAETGGVKDVDFSEYTFTEMEVQTVDEPEIPVVQLDISEMQIIIMCIIGLLLLIAGAGFEFKRFSAQAQLKGVKLA